VSYPLSALFGIPHGHACALTLPAMLVFNAGVTEEDVQDPRGAGFVRRRIDDLLEALGAGSPEEGCGRLTALVASTGLPTRLSELGLQSGDLARVVDQGFNPDRVTNNPRRLTRQALEEILEGIL
jgi:alcohol dehydrogenase class IV